VAGCGSIVFALAEDFTVASTGRFLVGLGVSVVFVGLMRSNTQWFSERRYGFISGLTLLLGNIGSILAAGPLALLLKTTSWRSVFIGIGILSLLLAALTAWLVRNRPEDAGLPSMREVEGKASHPPRQQHWLHDLRKVFTTAAVWPSFFIMFGITGSLFAFAGLWGVPLIQDVFGLERSAASLYTTTALIGFALGSFVMGWLSDHLGRRKPVLVGASAASVLAWLGLILLPWQTGVTGLLLYGLLGFTAGGFVVGYAAAKEVVSPGVAGMAIALVNTGLFLGAAIMQPAFGKILDLTWDGSVINNVRQYAWSDYQNGLWLSCGFALIALIASLFVHETSCRNITLNETPS
jgi:sugar phosphate permease